MKTEKKEHPPCVDYTVQEFCCLSRSCPAPMEGRHICLTQATIDRSIGRKTRHTLLCGRLACHRASGASGASTRANQISRHLFPAPVSQRAPLSLQSPNPGTWPSNSQAEGDFSQDGSVEQLAHVSGFRVLRLLAVCHVPSNGQDRFATAAAVARTC